MLSLADVQHLHTCAHIYLPKTSLSPSIEHGGLLCLNSTPTISGASPTPAICSSSGVSSVKNWSFFPWHIQTCAAPFPSSFPLICCTLAPAVPTPLSLRIIIGCANQLCSQSNLPCREPEGGRLSPSTGSSLPGKLLLPASLVREGAPRNVHTSI